MNMRERLRASNLIEGFDCPKMDQIAFVVWENRLNKGTKLTHTVIQNMQREITSVQRELDDMWRGTYRGRSRTHVTVGGRAMMHPSQVGAAMDDWLENWENMTPKEAHIAFEKIHPFIDGNGRVGRILFWNHQRQAGEPYTDITPENVQEYYRWFTEEGIDN